MTLESHSEFKMEFKIEQEPDGTFVGRSEQPKLEIRGATREEVLKKIQDSLGSRVLEKLGMAATAALDGSGVHVTVNKKISVVRRNADGTKSELFSTGNSSPAEISGTAPITAAPIDAPGRGATFLRWVLGLAVLLGMAWWFFHR
jgi:hypothetical protein